MFRFDDMEKYMRDKGYGAHAVAYFKVGYLYFYNLFLSRAAVKSLFYKNYRNEEAFIFLGLCLIFVYFCL